jgi:hypothetical protein
MIDLSKVKLGARPPKFDARTIRLKAFLKPSLLPPLPDAYDVDAALGMPIPDYMDGNADHGCCVISARAKQTRRFEAFEQGIVPAITDKEILDQYFLETGGPDAGLVVLDSLKRWRKEGWMIGGKCHKIYAFARADWRDHTECKYAVYLFNGMQVTLGLPLSAQHEDVWETTTGPGSEFGSWGFHQVYVPRWLANDTGPIVSLTWNRYQQMTWSWWDKYTAEAQIIIDDRDNWKPDSPVDVEKLAQLLIDVTNTPEAPTVESVTPSEGKQGETLKDVVITGTGVSVDIDVSFGAGVNMSGVHALSANEIKIDELIITYEAVPGLRPVALSNGWGFGFKVNAFTVLAGGNPPPDPIPPDPGPTPSPCRYGNAVASALNVAFMQKARNRRGRFYYLNP